MSSKHSGPPELFEGRPRPANIPAFFADSTSPSDFSAHWSRLWQGGWTPWDRGGPSLALHDLLNSVEHRHLFPSPLLTTEEDEDGAEQNMKIKRRKALVPGAGRGHDVLLLASHGYDAYGLDLAADAADAARENMARYWNTNNGAYAAKDPTVGRGTVTFLTGDFFEFDFSSVEGLCNYVDKSGIFRGFDLIFDYTVCTICMNTSVLSYSGSIFSFYLSLVNQNEKEYNRKNTVLKFTPPQKFLCALTPDLRPHWSRAIVRNLSHDVDSGGGGKLVCLEFPTTKPTDAQGPPFAVPHVLYEVLLTHPGTEIPYHPDTKAVDVEKLATLENKKEKGLEELIYYVPERTHKDGCSEEGKVFDRVSVWQHRRSDSI